MAASPHCKVCVLAPSARDDADVDDTCAQVVIREARVDCRQNCGNMSSAVGPFALEEGLVTAMGETATVRIFNTNMQRIIHDIFPVEDGVPRYDGIYPSLASAVLAPRPVGCCHQAPRWTVWGTGSRRHRGIAR